MNKKEIMGEFINQVYNKHLMTLLIKNIFNYKYFNDYNYLFRMKEEKNKIIIDIYDNISDHRFNRYVFIFKKGEIDIKEIKQENVYVTYVYVLNINEDSDNKLLKLGYLFHLRKNRMVEYASSFLDEKIVLILKKIITYKKDIHY